MKALTLIQPWSQLIALGAKRIETRSWNTSYRGPLAIHAGKGMPAYAKEYCHARIFQEALGWQMPVSDVPARIATFPRGCVIAVCALVDCRPTENRGGCDSEVFDDYPKLDTPQERAFGNFSPGRWGWILEDIIALPEPIPAKGALGLWEWAGQR